MSDRLQDIAAQMSSSKPSTVQAIVVHENKASVGTIPLPKTRPTYVLIKVDSVALNPTDWKSINAKSASPGGMAGMDMAGTVVEVGPEVTKSLKPGDRVAGVLQGPTGTNPDEGAFAEYVNAKGDLLVKLPDSLSFEDASTFPLGVSTVGQGLFQKALKLNLPTNPTKNGETVLIYGGSSATGSLGIQFAKLAGYRVITTCSPHNNDFVKALGADAVYDYKDPNCGKSINRDTNDSLKLVWDTIATPSSAQICDEAFSSDPSGARHGMILPTGKLPNKKDIPSKFTIMYTIFNAPTSSPRGTSPANPEDFEFQKEFFALTEKLLAEGKLKTHPAKVGANGLEGVLQGLEDMKNDKVSGAKLVYRVRETPKDSKVEKEF